MNAFRPLEILCLKKKKVSYILTVILVLMKDISKVSHINNGLYNKDNAWILFFNLFYMYVG